MSAVLSPIFPPTPAQVSYLGKLTGITGKVRLSRFVARRLGRLAPEVGGAPITKFDFSKAINAEVSDRRKIS